MSLQNKTIIDKLSLKEKIKFCSGATFWSTEHSKEAGVPEMIMTDGPHGVRMQKGAGDPSELYNCYPATCFPTASLAASTWNRDLIYRMGKAMGEEAMALGSDLLLGPGVNIKRNPLCGRNFEYYSEDPYLSGQIGSALIQGIQSTGRGACAKHFMGNNQETDRLICDDIMDERAMREIYLVAFEMIMKEANPSSVMASYNSVNGESMTNNSTIIRGILRNEWGYDGVVMSDWGAINDRVKSLSAGVDLEMPGSFGFYDKAVLKAVKKGILSEEVIDEAVDHLLTVIFKNTAAKSENGEFDTESHHALAEKIAGEGGVLLKNNGILPLDMSDKVALIGGMADNMRYQGSGSSHITPTKVVSILDAFKESKADFTYYPGYKGQDEADEEFLKEAVEGAGKAEKVVLVIGLSDAYESEGYDRKDMGIPDAHIKLLQSIYEVNPNIIVVLAGGAPVTMDWEPETAAILNMYLGGQAAGAATVSLLYGRINPSGKLAETYPMQYEDVPSSKIFAKEPRQAFYDESIYVGYRYYDKAGVKVRYPFGHGLSYTVFDYTDIKVEGNGYDYTVMVTVTNIGNMDGAEVVQLYVHDVTGMEFKPVKELKGFEKIYLRAGESGMVTFKLNKRSFAYYEVSTASWEVTKGNYEILIGSSSANIMLSQNIELDGIEFNNENVPDWYKKPSKTPSRDDFIKLNGKETESYKYPKRGEFTPMTPLCDMQESGFVRFVTKTICKIITRQFKGNPDKSALKMELEQLMTAPLQALYLQGHMRFPFWIIRFIVRMGNGLKKCK